MTKVGKLNRTSGVGREACEAIRAGMTNAEALDYVRETLPDARTTQACISWYRNHMRKQGERVMTARELKSAREAELDTALGLDRDAA